MRSITLVAATGVLACLLISCAAISARKQDPHINLFSNPRFLVGLQTVYVLIGILVSLRILFILSNSEAISFTTNSGIANSSSIAGVFPGQPYSYMLPLPYSERPSAYPISIPGSSGVPRVSSQPSNSGIRPAYAIPEAFEPSYVANPIRSLYPAQPVGSVRPPGYAILPQSGHVKPVMPSYPAQPVGSLRPPGYAILPQSGHVKPFMPSHPAQPVSSVRPFGYTIPSQSGHVNPVTPSYPAQPVGSVRPPGYTIPSRSSHVNPVTPSYPAQPVGSVRPPGYGMPSQPNYVNPVIPPHPAQPVDPARPLFYNIPAQSILALSNDPGQPASATSPQVASLTVPVSLNQFVRRHLDPRHNPVFNARINASLGMISGAPEPVPIMINQTSPVDANGEPYRTDQQFDIQINRSVATSSPQRNADAFRPWRSYRRRPYRNRWFAICDCFKWIGRAFTIFSKLKPYYLN